MLYADAIRRQAEDAPRAALPAVTAALWRAFAEGHVTEAEAEALSAMIEARQAKSATVAYLRSPVSGTSNVGVAHISRSPDLATSLSENQTVSSDRQGSPRTGVGSRPRSDASLERRRRWAASGRLPPAIAARFTLAEQAALALIAAETARKGDCRLAIEHMAAVAGVSRSTVKSAIREAKKLGLLTVEERKVAGWRNDTNIIRIVSPEWTTWLRLARRSPILRSGLSLRREQRGGGVKTSTGTSTEISKQGKTRTAEEPRGRSASQDRASRGSLRIAGA